MDDADKFTVLNGGPGSTPLEALALVAKMSDSERLGDALESGESSGLTSAAETDTIRYGTSVQHSFTFLFVTSRLLSEVYYLLYGDNYEMPSKVAIDTDEPSLGRIRADSVAPPHTPASIKRCISRVEKNPALAHANLYADTSCDTPLKEGHISILRTDGPGLSPNEPMAIVQVEFGSPGTTASFPDGRYAIKNGAADIFWFTANTHITGKTVYFGSTTVEAVKRRSYAHCQVNKNSPIIQVFTG